MNLKDQHTDPQPPNAPIPLDQYRPQWDGRALCPLCGRWWILRKAVTDGELLPPVGLECPQCGNRVAFGIETAVAVIEDGELLYGDFELRPAEDPS